MNLEKTDENMELKGTNAEVRFEREPCLLYLKLIRES